MFRSSQVLSWPMIAIKRPFLGFDSVAIVVPAICPNCMAAGTIGDRTGHKYFMSNTTYYQTFWYCRDCYDVIEHERGTKVRQWVVGIVLGAATAALLIKGQASEPLAISLSLTAGVITGSITGIVRRYNKSLPPNALGRTPAAYYTGQSVGGFGTRDIYRARRKEWLDLLVNANPEKVSDDRSVAGQAKQAQAKPKPF